MALYREQIAQSELRAPFDGAVARRHLDPGATVQPGTSVLRLVEDGPLDVRFQASELHLSRLTPKTRLSVKTLATGDRVFGGRLMRISAEVNRTDRSIEAEGVLDERHEQLRPGMYVTVQVSLGTLEDKVILPEATLVSRLADDGSSEQAVYVVEDGLAHYVPVEVLGRDEKRVAVSGVEAGAAVVVRGQDLLSDGARVQVVGDEVP